jgi:hypothetical protein
MGLLPFSTHLLCSIGLISHLRFAILGAESITLPIQYINSSSIVLSGMLW